MSQIVISILSLVILAIIYKLFFIESLPAKDILYVFHGKLSIFQISLLIICFVILFFGINTVVEVAFDEKEKMIVRIVTIVSLPIIYFSLSLIIQLLCGVPSIFYFINSPVGLIKLFLVYSSIVILISYLQYYYLKETKQKLYIFLFEKLKKIFKK
ncbi:MULTISPECIES: hypothetical protein [Acinetobacter]|uniref:hypothetical protein n=1 Tax=Acinetobacter TaxID=469 RepID=UPI0022E37801|nr:MULTISPECIES: hypothetical protein [Acinetobacter]MDI1222796.1 hypothetical protein [Acinetobacter sp.]